MEPKEDFVLFTYVSLPPRKFPLQTDQALFSEQGARIC